MSLLLMTNTQILTRKPMANIELKSTLAYVQSLDLPALPSSRSMAGPAEGQSVDFDTFRKQMAVVGSEVVSFAEGVTAQRRQDIINATHLAQLAANKKVTDREDILAWYDTYFDVLTNLGWVLQDRGFSEYTEKADGLEAHEAILKVAAMLLGSAPTALAIVTSTLQAMKSMDADNPWITIFNRESRAAKAARFQISLAEQEGNGQFMVTTMAFALNAKSEVLQVLFFKVHKNEAMLKHCSGKVTINDEILAGVRETVRIRLAGRTQDFVAALNL